MQWCVGVVLLAALTQATWAQNCRYGKGDGYVRGDCDPSTNTRTTTMVLKKGDQSCAPTKDFTRPCRGTNDDGEGCKYQWEEGAENAECDPETNMRMVRMTLIEGDPATCEETKTSQRRCDGVQGDTDKGRKGNRKASRKGDGDERKKGRKGHKGHNMMDDGDSVQENGCKYGKGEDFQKSNCTQGEDEMWYRNVTLVLVKGDKDSCSEEKTVVKECGDCKYKKQRDEEMPACDPVTKEKTLTLIRTEGDPETCPDTKTVTKPCVPEGCVYSDGEWSECGEGDKVSLRVDTLVTSPEGVQCEATIERRRSCRAIARKEARKDAKKEGKKAAKKAARKEAKKAEKKAEKAEQKEGKKQKKQERKEKRKQRQERQERREKKGHGNANYHQGNHQGRS